MKNLVLRKICISFLQLKVCVNKPTHFYLFQKRCHNSQNYILDENQFLFSTFVTMQTFRSRRPEVFLKKVFWKYAANLQENTHAEVRFQ